MSEEIKSVDTNDIEEDKPVVVRNEKGRFVKGVSGNPNGRGKGNQSKLNKTKMVTSLNKHGLQSIEAILRIAKKAEKAEQLPTAMKGYAFIAEQYLKAVAQQDKTALELQKLRMKESKDDGDSDEEDNDLTQAIFQWQRAEND
jgi:hypothetical protein